MIPSKWGQGQLFAFSAVDGESFFSDDFTGTLAADKIGIIFHTKIRRTLFFTDIKSAPDFSCVASDVIAFETASGKHRIIFAQRHLIIGETTNEHGVFVSVDGECETIRKGNVEIHDTADGEYTAILKAGNRFAFAYAQSIEKAVELAEKYDEMPDIIIHTSPAVMGVEFDKTKAYRFWEGSFAEDVKEGLRNRPQLSDEFKNSKEFKRIVK